MRPVRSGKLRQCTKRHLQNVLRYDRYKLSRMLDTVDFQAQPRWLIGAGIQSRSSHGTLQTAA